MPSASPTTPTFPTTPPSPTTPASPNTPATPACSASNTRRLYTNGFEAWAAYIAAARHVLAQHASEIAPIVHALSTALDTAPAAPIRTPTRPAYIMPEGDVTLASYAAAVPEMDAQLSVDTSVTRNLLEAVGRHRKLLRPLHTRLSGSGDTVGSPAPAVRALADLDAALNRVNHAVYKDKKFFLKKHEQMQAWFDSAIYEEG